MPVHIWSHQTVLTVMLRLIEICMLVQQKQSNAILKDSHLRRNKFFKIGCGFHSNSWISRCSLLVSFGAAWLWGSGRSIPGPRLVSARTIFSVSCKSRRDCRYRHDQQWGLSSSRSVVSIDSIHLVHSVLRSAVWKYHKLARYSNRW